MPLKEALFTGVRGRGILGSSRRGASRKYIRWWSTHPRLSRYSHRPGRSRLVAETTPGEHDDRHCEHREHPQAHRGGLGRGEVQNFGHYLLPYGHVEGAVEESDDDHAAPGTVVDPHDEHPQEHGDERRQEKVPQ